MKYYELDEDAAIKGRWHLGSPVDRGGQELHAELFRVAKRVSLNGPIRITVDRDGLPLDWTFAHYSMPVVKVEVGELVKGLAGSDVELHPCSIDGFEEHSFCVLNVLARRECVDEAKSEFVKFEEDDGRPDKIGDYLQITRLRIKEGAARGCPIFRIDRSLINLIVSEKMRMALDDRGVTGLAYRLVTD